jgi:hypothetical protein
MSATVDPVLPERDRYEVLFWGDKNNDETIVRVRTDRKDEEPGSCLYINRAHKKQGFVPLSRAWPDLLSGRVPQELINSNSGIGEILNDVLIDDRILPLKDDSLSQDDEQSHRRDLVSTAVHPLKLPKPTKRASTPKKTNV